MPAFVLPALLWFSAIGCGMIAGIYFIFSASIMSAFGRMPGDSGLAAMQAINDDIVRSPFIAVFSATSVAAAVLSIWAVLRWADPGAG